MSFQSFGYQPIITPTTTSAFPNVFTPNDMQQQQQSSMGIMQPIINNPFSTPLSSGGSPSPFSSSPLTIQQPISTIPNNAFSVPSSSSIQTPSSIGLNQSLFSSPPNNIPPSSMSTPSPIFSSPPSSSIINTPFLCLIAGRSPITSFQAVDASMRKFLLQIPKGGMVDQMSFSLLQPSALSAFEGIGIYASIYPYSNWSFIGAVSSSFPTSILAMPWKGNLSDNDAQIGLSVESLEFLSAQQAKLSSSQGGLSTALIPSSSSSSSNNGMISGDDDPSKILDDAKGIAKDLYTFMASFSQTGGQYKNLGDVLVIPTTCIDNWMQKFQTKHNREPFFWRKINVDTVD